MTSHALTPEQETMLKMAAFQIRDSFPAHSLYMEVLRDLARTLLEPLEKERDEAIAHDRQPYPTAWAYEQACAALHATTAELAEAREENTRLREQLDKANKKQAAMRVWLAPRRKDSTPSRLHADTCKVPNAYFADDMRCTCGMREAVE